MNKIYEKKKNPVRDFPEVDGIVRREFSSNGGLYSGSGNWGWFDSNNLPKTTTYHEFSEYKKEDETKKNDKNSKDDKKETEKTTKASDTNEQTSTSQEPPEDNE